MLATVAKIYWLCAAVIFTAIAHMFVVKANLLGTLARPIDGGRRLGAAPIFGPTKTWRGVVVMIAGAAIAGAVQGLLGGAWAEARGLAALDYQALGRLVGAPGALAATAGYTLVGATLGLGFVLGELPNSFLKRRLEIPSGERGSGARAAFFFVVDRLDSVLGGLLLVLYVFRPSLGSILVAVLALSGLHLTGAALLAAAGVKRRL